jgi:hypothetical protein
LLWRSVSQRCHNCPMRIQMDVNRRAWTRRFLASPTIGFIQHELTTPTRSKRDHGRPAQNRRAHYWSRHQDPRRDRLQPVLGLADVLEPRDAAILLRGFDGSYRRSETLDQHCCDIILHRVDRLNIRQRMRRVQVVAAYDVGRHSVISVLSASMSRS